MEHILREHTLDKARRLIRCRMQVHLCKMRWDEAGPDVSVWEQMHWLASGFLEGAKKDWFEWLRTSVVLDTELSPIIVEALAEAKRTAAVPYQGRLDPKWIESQINVFMRAFNPQEMYPQRGDLQ